MYDEYDEQIPLELLKLKGEPLALELEEEHQESGEDIYSDMGNDSLLDTDEISPSEAAFMLGYNTT